MLESQQGNSRNAMCESDAERALPVASLPPYNMVHSGDLILYVIYGDT